MKLRFAILFMLALCTASAAAQSEPVAPSADATAQQAPTEAPSPAEVVPAAPPPPVIVVPGPRPYPPPPRRLLPPQLHPLRQAVRRDAIALGIGAAVLWRNEDHRQFDNGQSNAAVDLFASYDVWAERRFALSAGLSYRHDRRPRTQLAELNESVLTADLMGRVRAASWLWPHLRAGIGFATTRAKVADALDLEDRATGAAASFGAGFTLRTRARALETESGALASLSLGLLIEGGYTLAQDAELSPRADHRELRSVSAASFRAERSAAFLRMLAVVRF